jgi:hypothetical protein
LGCRDRDSNFNAVVFSEKDQKWWAHWGEPSVEAPSKEAVIDKIMESSLTESLDGWDLRQLESGRWKATQRPFVANA